MAIRTGLVSALLFISFTVCTADEKEFSGPQVNEKVVPFKARSVFGETAGKEIDPVADSGAKPLLIVFIHELTRPSIGLVRTVGNYAKKREKHGLKSYVVFLGEDATELEARVKRAQRALPPGVGVGISVDGKEGPGAYGLNRKMTITALVAKDGKVTANFAIVQPSVAADAPKIGEAIAKVLGDKKGPTLKEMGGERFAMNKRNPNANADGRFRQMLAPVIQKTATQDDVDKAAKAVEELAEKNAAFKNQLITVSNRIINAGRLENYGTPHAQTYLKKWAKLEKSVPETEKNE